MNIAVRNILMHGAHGKHGVKLARRQIMQIRTQKSDILYLQSFRQLFCCSNSRLRPVNGCDMSLRQQPAQKAGYNATIASNLQNFLPELLLVRTEPVACLPIKVAVISAGKGDCRFPVRIFYIINTLSICLPPEFFFQFVSGPFPQLLLQLQINAIFIFRRANPQLYQILQPCILLFFHTYDSYADCAPLSVHAPLH